MKRYSGEGHVNVGTGDEVSILDLANMVSRAVGLDAEIIHDLSKPDGTPRKRLDCSKLEALGWRRRIPLPDGLADAYRWFLEHETATAR